MSAALTALPAPFTWAGDHVTAELPYAVRVLFTTRRGGVSRPPYDSLNLGRLTDDEPAATEENRERLRELTGADRLAFGRQVHGSVVVRDAEAFVEADGQVTTRRGVAPMVLTADCMAVALASPDAVGAVHAGWRGLADGVLEEGLEQMGEGPFFAAIGPCARDCCYEVGDDVRAALGAPEVGEPATIDLPGIARERLTAAGVDEVFDSGLCTMCNPDLFFSHRRDGALTGRQAGVVWR